MKYLLITLIMANVLYAEWTSSKETDPITDEVTSIISTRATSERFSYNLPTLGIRFTGTELDGLLDIWINWETSVGSGYIPTCLGRIDTETPYNYHVLSSTESPNNYTFFPNTWNLFVNLIRGDQFAAQFTPAISDDAMTAIFDLHGMTAAAREAGIPIDLITAKVDSVNYLFDSRFTETGGVITDQLTDLQWCVGPDSDTNWNDANSWVNGLGDSWRMPTINELRVLYNANIKYGHWGQFQNSGYWVWSSLTDDSSSAWCFGFFDGGEYYYYRNYDLDERAFAVRP